MSDESQGPGWWLASDGKWYAPELHPSAQPQQPAQPSYVPPGGSGYPQTNSADAGAALSYGWNRFTKNAGPLVAIILVPIAVQFLLSFVGRAMGGAGSILLSAISLLIGFALEIGIFNAALMTTAGAPIDIAGAFRSDRWGEWILFAFVWWLMTLVGIALCVVGVFFVIAIWGLAPFYFIDQNMSVGEALRASSQATSANPGMRVALGLVALVGVLGIVACLVGLFVTIPVAYIGAAYLYRIANHQTVAA